MAQVRLLKGVPLDNSYQNPILFKPENVTLPSNMKMVSYQSFFSKYDVDWDKAQFEMNVKIGDGINTSIIVGESQYHPSYNYCVISFDKSEINPSVVDTNSSSKKYFYFITNVIPLGRGNYNLILELDVVTTYFRDMTIDHPIYTERKHCNRWQKINNDYLLEWKDAVKGDVIDGYFSANKLSENEYILYNYFSSTRIKTPSNKVFLDNFANNTMWMYIFYTQFPSTLNVTDAFNKLVYSPLKIVGKNNDMYSTQIMCVAVPLSDLYITYYKGSTTTTKTINYSNKSEQSIKGLLSIPSCIGAKLSFRPPFSNKSNYKGSGSDPTYIDVDDNFNTIIKCGSQSKHVSADTFYSYFYNLGNITISKTGTSVSNEEIIMFVNELPSSIVSSEDLLINQPNGSVFKTQYIDTYKQSYNDFYEPKLYCQPFYQLNITTQYGGSYTYNPLMFNDRYVKASYCCELNVEVDRIYFNLSSTNDTSPYYLLQKNNIGAIISNDNNIPFISDKSAEYLSQHRASMITGMAVNSVSSGIKGALSGAKYGSEGAIVGGIFGYVSSLAMGVSSMLDLKNTPDGIKNTGNNPIHDFAMQNDYKPYLQTYELFERDREQVYTFFYDNGYLVNRKCYLNLRDYTDTNGMITRQKFNYIKIKDDIIGEMKFYYYNTVNHTEVDEYVPQAVKVTINNILNRGLKLWTLIYTPTATQDDWQDFYLDSTMENAEICLPQ